MTETEKLAELFQLMKSELEKQDILEAGLCWLLAKIVIANGYRKHPEPKEQLWICENAKMCHVDCPGHFQSKIKVSKSCYLPTPVKVEEKSCETCDKKYCDEWAAKLKEKPEPSELDEAQEILAELATRVARSDEDCLYWKISNLIVKHLAKQERAK
jgi:hypothetical protein